MTSALIPKLLSHRLRGYDRFEHTPAAMRAATGSAAMYLEVDTRVSRDGVVFVYHDPVTTALGRRLSFARTDAAELERLRYPDGQPLLRLAEALEIFRAGKAPGQRISIDIKDFGFEEEHVRLVEDAGLRGDTDFVSWIPQSLTRVAALSPDYPLILSHTNVLGLGWPGASLARMSGRWMRRLGHFVIIGNQRCDDELGDFCHGFQHTLLTDRVPVGLRDVLAGSGGGICVHRSQAGRALGRYCADEGLALWVYSVNTSVAFRRWAGREDVDVVFSDNAPAVSSHPVEVSPELP